MASTIYEVIGRLVVRLIWLRFCTQIKIAGGVLAVTSWSPATLAKRQPPEG